MNRIRLYNTTTLSSSEFETRLALAADETRWTRRKVPEHAADGVWNYEGVIYRCNGRVWPIYDIDPDTIFRTDADPGQRWYSEFKKRAGEARKRAMQERRFERLELLTVAIAIIRPDLAKAYDLCLIED